MRKFISMAKITKDTTVNQSTPVSPKPEKKVVETKEEKKPIKKTTPKKIKDTNERSK